MDYVLNAKSFFPPKMAFQVSLIVLSPKEDRYLKPKTDNSRSRSAQNWHSHLPSSAHKRHEFESL